VEALEKAEQLKTELDSLRPFDAEREARVWQKLRLDWNYHSNKLEGNSYTYGETRMLLYSGNTAGGKPQRDSEEISGHNEAINFILEVIRDKNPLSEILIRHLHQMILVKPHYADAKTFDGSPTKKLIKVGEYKTEPNHVETETGETFRFAEPIDTPAQMEELVGWFREKIQSSETNPIFLAAEFHYKFVRIHPFDDGNGRMARLLMNFILMQYGYPPVIIRNEDKSNYIAALTQSDFGILRPFLDYIAANLVQSLEMMIKGVKGEDIEEPEDLDKALVLLEREIRGIGKKVEIALNKEVQVELLDKSLIPLGNALIESGRKFDKFYLDHHFYVHINNTPAEGEFDNALYYAKKKIAESSQPCSDLKIQYLYRAFNQDGLGSFDYTSAIYVAFEVTKYIVVSEENIYGQYIRNVIRYDKLYSEQLSEKEIEELVNLKAAQHVEFISNKLQAFKSEKK
jgi:Fic family protein